MLDVPIEVDGRVRVTEVELGLRVCATCAERLTVADLMPDAEWARFSAALLRVLGGRANRESVVLRFASFSRWAAKPVNFAVN